MKFSNGLWLNREGVDIYSPAEVADLSRDGAMLRLTLPHRKIRHRGQTLGGPVLTAEITSPMEDVIRVKAYHFKGGKASGPAFALAEDRDVRVTIEDTADTVTFTSGRIRAR